MIRFLASTLVLFAIHVAHVYGQNVAKFIIDIDVRHQQIDNFGASDCWTFQHIDTRTPLDLRNHIVDLLFSSECDKQGNPLGIGLSLWRFNIGSGSAENPKNVIDGIWHTTDCFLDTLGNYDFMNKQKAQLWVLKAAKERGCTQFLGFCNSPPYFMTANGQSTNIGRHKGSLNLDPLKYGQFANFLANVWTGLKEHHGITLNYISPFNEPEWDWEGKGQEGTPASISEIAAFFKILDREFSAKKVNATILATEAGEYSYLYKDATSKPHIDNQIWNLYNPASPNYIGDLKHISNIIAGHSYWTSHPAALKSTREELRKVLDAHQLKLWQTELCIMSNDIEIGGGGKRDFSMETALYVARVIHNDLTVANASSWQWWTAASVVDYKDGLVYLDQKDQVIERVHASKLLWSLGNYSRFIRPGAYRLNVESVSKNDNLMVSSYINKNSQIVTVIINYSQSDQQIALYFPGKQISSSISYLTSDKAEDNLKYYGEITSLNKIDIHAKSITTIVSKLD